MRAICRSGSALLRKRCYTEVAASYQHSVVGLALGLRSVLLAQPHKRKPLDRLLRRGVFFVLSGLGEWRHFLRGCPGREFRGDRPQHG